MKKKSIFNFLPPLLLAVAMMFSFSVTAKTIYVKTASAGGDDVNGDGQTWGTAYATYQKAMSVVAANDEVWIAAGTYITDYTSATVLTSNDVAFSIYGGFTGDETSVNDRQQGASGYPWDFANPTVIQATTEHPIFYINNKRTPLVDGIIFDGNNMAPCILFRQPTNYSGGIKNCIVKNGNAYRESPFAYSTGTNDFASGGINIGSDRNEASGSGMPAVNTLIENCLIENNTGRLGGGIFAKRTTIINCVVRNNLAKAVASSIVGNYTATRDNGCTGNGGGIATGHWNNTSNVVNIINCVITGNTAEGVGGGVQAYIGGNSAGSGCNIINCIIADNHSSDGTSGMPGGGGGLNTAQWTISNVYNTLFWNNTKGAANTLNDINRSSNSSSTFNLYNNIIPTAVTTQQPNSNTGAIVPATGTVAADLFAAYGSDQIYKTQSGIWLGFDEG
ncbi:MAG: hypothetical protein LBH32_13590, partial [Dysgonamonadaceae bacterium]|nr:hypothetical protein [Dysgonamonadaceae bacterium]